jgi:antirestriction protein ArdC
VESGDVGVEFVFDHHPLGVAGVQSRFRKYSFGNCLLIMAQRPDATRAASFRKWQELDRSVNKGEQGIRIFAPSTRKVEVETEDGEVKQEAVTEFRLVPVFDVQQTSGAEPPEPLHLLQGEDAHGVFGKLSKVAEGIGYDVQVTPEIVSHPGANGLCEYGPKKITVAGNRSELQQVKSLAHEIGHALLHGNPEAGLSRSTFELEAESTAYVVCQSLGLDTSDYSFGYCAAWKQGDAEKAREQIKASGAGSRRPRSRSWTSWRPRPR